MLREVKDQTFSFANGKNFLCCNQTSKRGLIGYNRSPSFVRMTKMEEIFLFFRVTNESET